jgi:hypothetical protein
MRLETGLQAECHLSQTKVFVGLPKRTVLAPHLLISDFHSQ